MSRMIVCAGLMLALWVAAARAQGFTQRVSESAKGVEADNKSSNLSMSADGRYVAFASEATNLIPGDTNQSRDVFVVDRRKGTITRVSVSSTGAQANHYSGLPALSADGRYVAFTSWASNLVSGDTNAEPDVFVHDLVLARTTRVSVSSTGGQGDLGSLWSAISADGRYVAFVSDARNLVPADTNAMSDVFVRDRLARVTTRVSVDSQGRQGDLGCFGPAITPDGRVVAFASDATNLVPADRNSYSDVFVHDQVTRTTERVSLSWTGQEATWASFGASLSADGRYVLFGSVATNLVPVAIPVGRPHLYLRDRKDQTTTLVSASSNSTPGNGNHMLGGITGDGRFAAFMSSSNNLDPADLDSRYDYFVRDLKSGTTTRISHDAAGNDGGSGGWIHDSSSAISADGHTVAYLSDRTHLVPFDGNGVLDVFVHDDYPRLVANAPARIGTQVPLDLFAPNDPGRNYLMGSSLLYQPGIRVDTRWVPLEPDVLLAMSLSLPRVFQGYAGFLNGFGRAHAAVVIPPSYALVGLTFYTAFIVQDNTAASGVGSISGALTLRIVL